MANHKKRPSDRKKGLSVSITTKHLEDFLFNCDKNNDIPSHVVEQSIIEYNLKS